MTMISHADCWNEPTLHATPYTRCHNTIPAPTSINKRRTFSRKRQGRRFAEGPLPCGNTPNSPQPSPEPLSSAAHNHALPLVPAPQDIGLQCGEGVRVGHVADDTSTAIRKADDIRYGIWHMNNPTWPRFHGAMASGSSYQGSTVVSSEGLVTPCLLLMKQMQEPPTHRRKDGTRQDDGCLTSPTQLWLLEVSNHHARGPQ
ncbi:hypothetical protein B0T19DRAFT_261600 [Cercophora scortea]|uniref:Uncharacterized protein n=1 Tax=Cercophora scortea TaxID=314031 RepID=A0AAE0I9U2_9PEZI|nr:hypothetical protein B0T19DRAFT_261600 [Cercophora scortea]